MAEGEDIERRPSAITDHILAAVEVLCVTQNAQHQLSQMADQKASILMGTTFVIFTIAVGQSNYHSLAFVPLLVLGGFAFVAAVLATMAVLPAIHYRKTGSVNLLFFGSFTRFREEEYIQKMLDVLMSEEEIYRTIARDIYQNGSVLAKKKFHLLGYAYRVFLAGLTASLLTFIIQFAHNFHQ